MKDETLFNLFDTAMQGWQCPICKRVYSPYTHMCPYCGNQSFKNNKNQEENKSEEMIFTLTPNEVDEYNKFIEEHKNCKCSATIGGKISVIFTPTGLGNAKSVKCNVCGKEKEITDVSNW